MLKVLNPLLRGLSIETGRTAARVHRLLSIGIVIAVVQLPAGAALGSDYFHDCSAVGGESGYELVPDKKEKKLELRRKGSDDVITVDKEVRRRLTEISGYCASRAGHMRFKTEVYGVILEFTDKGTKRTRKFRCERLQDEMPASATCDREMRLIDWKAPSDVFAEFQ